MRCETCHGGTQPPAEGICHDCGNTGISHCCEGLQAATEAAETPEPERGDDVEAQH